MVSTYNLRKTPVLHHHQKVRWYGRPRPQHLVHEMHQSRTQLWPDFTLSTPSSCSESPRFSTDSVFVLRMLCEREYESPQSMKLPEPKLVTGVLSICTGASRVRYHLAFNTEIHYEISFSSSRSLSRSQSRINRSSLLAPKME